MINSLDLAAVSHFGIDKKSPMEARRKAALQFSRALSKGAWQKVWCKLTGKDNKLQSLAQLNSNSTGKKTPVASIINVPINKIVGSEDRSGDFDKDFNPLKAHLHDRWTGIAAARRLGVILPPVELIQVEDNYYVRDGHHRISVAKACGQKVIEAQIV